MKHGKSTTSIATIGNLIITVIAAVFLWGIYQLWLPTLSLAYLDGFLFIALCVIVGTAVVALWIKGEDGDYNFYIPIGGFIILIVIMIIGMIAGSRIFNSTTMYKQIGEIEEKSFKEDVVEIDNSQIPTVDIALASKLADKKLGEDIGLGSQMEVGDFTNKQNVNGKLVYVAPLEHTGFLKWWSNSNGTAGYVIVSATNSNDVQFVKDIDGKSLKLKYVDSAFFSSDLKRHIRSQGYRTVGLTEYTFELNDEGRPFYVVTTYKNKTLWGTPEATGVVICDVQNGECEWYSVEDTPEWVDIIQPESFIQNQLENYGKYVRGWWNPSNKDMLSVTEHMTTVYNNGQCYYYTGMSSVGKDDGTVGFMMVNTRDKSVKMYKMVGATENAAMRSAEGKVQNMKYSATCPIPLNVSGIPTYFLTLKDDEGLVKNYAMINIEDYSIVSTGNTISEAKRAYINAMSSIGNNVAFSDKAYGYTKEGIVTRISNNIEDGNSYYYMIIDDDRSNLYMASYTVSEELPVTREGDKVKVGFLDEANGTINIVEFDNLEFSQKVSSDQQKKNEERTSIMEDHDNKIVEVNPEKNEDFWNSLSDEEKAELLKDSKKENEE